MVFTPENELERAMLLAASQPSARPDFYRLLLASELVVMGELGQSLSLETVENAGVKYHPVFTAVSRITAIAAADAPHFKMQGRVLFEATRGAPFVINPGSEVGKTVTPEEVAWFLETFTSGHGDLIVAQPRVFPTKLVKALCVLFTSRSLIRAAHLVYVARQGIDREGHPMIGLEADGDVPRLAQEIFEIAQAVLPGEPLEVVYLNPSKALDPLQTHLQSVAPFYRRTLPMN